MNKSINEIIPVMLTPFSEDGAIDYAGLERLIEWYLQHGADGLFAVCQSSEMQFLSLTERAELGRFVVQRVAGRVPVVVSGHIGDSVDDQVAELKTMAGCGADALILVTNRLDRTQAGTPAFRATLERLMGALPAELPLGLYECPAPFRRLLSDEEVGVCADTGRFVMLKDVSCDLTTIKRRLALAAGTPLAIINAYAAVAYPAIQARVRGFCGVFTNVHPDLYKWLLRDDAASYSLTDELVTFLVLVSVAEPWGYPALAKLYHQRIGTFGSIRCRVIDYDIRERFWALDAILDQIEAGTEAFRKKIAAAQAKR